MYPIFHTGNFFPLSWNFVVPIISVFILIYLIQSVLSFAIYFIYWTQRNDNEKLKTPIQILIIFSPNCFLRYSNFFLKISCSLRYTVICIFFSCIRNGIYPFLLTEEIPRSEDLRIALITNQFIQYLVTLPRESGLVPGVQRGHYRMMPCQHLTAPLYVYSVYQRIQLYLDKLIASLLQSFPIQGEK